MKRAATVFFIAVLLFSSPALAFDDDYSDASAEAIIVDFVVVRPLSIAATAIGCGFFVATLPFTVWSKERMGKTADALVVKPASYAFVRPLGEEMERR
ncbi:MAG: hypothetical protein R2940_05070 [Syntrophotaleaceae bacterium]